MNPHLRNKVDMKNMSSDEKAALLYGKSPKPNDFLKKKLNERKYFDSGDYALSKAGQGDSTGVSQIGREHPQPENIPHSSLALSPTNSTHNGGGMPGTPKLSPPIGGQSGSPIKESSFLYREQSADDQPGTDVGNGKHGEAVKDDGGDMSPPPQREGMPIRQLQ